MIATEQCFPLFLCRRLTFSQQLFEQDKGMAESMNKGLVNCSAISFMDISFEHGHYSIFFFSPTRPTIVILCEGKGPWSSLESDEKYLNLFPQGEA